MVVGDTKILRFDRGTGTLLPEGPFGFETVAAAGHSNGKLFLAHTIATGGLMSWLPLR